MDSPAPFRHPGPEDAFLPPLYFPPVGWFLAAAAAQCITLSPQCPMVKHSLQNRTHIKASEGVLRLTVPTLAEGRSQGYATVRIDYTRPWQRDHQRSIANYYRNSAYFEHYWPELEPILLHPHPTLPELNQALLEQLWRLMGFDTPLTHLSTVPESPRLWLPKWSLWADCSPPGAVFRSYYQLYGPFVPNLSILDLLFHLGPRARILLRESAPHTAGE